jgi:hypothetical protein
LVVRNVFNKATEGRVVFLERNAALRSDQSFRNRIHEDHHNGDSILEQLDIDMVLDFPVDPMHLVDLGVCRKLLLTWIRGPLERRISKNLIEIISARLELLRDFIPREFARLSRSLKFIDRWKATEFGLFISYIGPVVLAGILSGRMFNNFLVFHVAVRILSSNEYCFSQNEYARKLLHLFVAECQNIYGSYFLSFNVHCLIHLCDDVMRFGSLPNFSAYPFENYLQSLKKLLRKSNQALQQVIKRLMERFHIDATPKTICYDSRQYRFKLQHDSGPLLPNLIRSSKQYREMHLGPWYLSCKEPNNCVYLKDSSVILIENFVANAMGDFICGRRYRQTGNLYNYPIPSTSYNFVRVERLSDSLEFWPLIDVKCKAVRVPNFVGCSIEMDGTFAVFPLLMEENN